MIQRHTFYRCEIVLSKNIIMDHEQRKCNDKNSMNPRVLSKITKWYQKIIKHRIRFKLVNQFESGFNFQSQETRVENGSFYFPKVINIACLITWTKRCEMIHLAGLQSPQVVNIIFTKVRPSFPTFKSQAEQT